MGIEFEFRKKKRDPFILWWAAWYAIWSIRSWATNFKNNSCVFIYHFMALGIFV
jgi:hypothetical protein